MISTLEYLKVRERMCKTVDNCSECGLYDDGMCELETTNPLQAIEIVENWAKENPVKTYMSVFLEKFPKASVYPDSNPIVCAGYVFGFGCKHGVACEKCWNQEYKEDNNEK